MSIKSLNPLSHCLGATAAVGGALLCLSIPLSASATDLFGDQAIAVGATVEGVLTDHSPALADQSRFASYVFHGEKGQRVTISLSSGDFDSQIIFGPVEAFASDASCSGCQYDDDGPRGSQDPVLVVVLPRTGSYRILADSVQPFGLGRYRLSIR